MNSIFTVSKRAPHGTGPRKSENGSGRRAQKWTGPDTKTNDGAMCSIKRAPVWTGLDARLMRKMEKSLKSATLAESLDKYDASVQVAYRLYPGVRNCEREILNSPRGALQSSEDGDADVSEEEEDEDPNLDFGHVFKMFGSPENSPKINNAWLPKELEEWSTYSDDVDDNPSLTTDWATVEATMLCMRQLYRARDFEDYGIAIIQFLKAFTGRTACSMFSDVVSHAITLLRGVGCKQSGGTNIFSELRGLLATAKAVSQHPLLLKFKRVLWYVLSFATLAKVGVTFDNFYYSQAEAEQMKKEYTSEAGYLHAVFDGVTNLLERLVDCYQKGSWSPLLASGAAYARWCDEVYDLKAKSTLLHNPTACGFSYHEYLGRLDAAIDDGTTIIKFEQDKKVATGIKRLLTDLEILRSNELTKKAARASRDAPFSVLYYGGSSLAKTTIQDLMHVHFAKVHGLPDGDEYKYTRISADQYFSGFMTQMWSIVVDDIANLNPNLGLDPSMGEVLQLRNNAAYCPPQADLADKGRTPVLCELLQASTNTKMLNAHSYYNNPLAIMRRWNFVVTVTLKAQYALHPGGVIPDPHARMLDGSKVPVPAPGEYPDIWEFEVEKVIASQNSTVNKQVPAFAPVMKTSSIYEFMAFMSQESTIFRQQQASIKQGAQVFKDVTVCKRCFMPAKYCSCTAGILQSSEMTEGAGKAIIAAGAVLMAACVPKVLRRVRTAVQSVVPTVEVTCTEVGTRVAKKIAGNLLREAKDTIAPKLIDILADEGYLSNHSSEHLYQGESEEEESLRQRLLELSLPSEVPEFCWYESIQIKLLSLPVAQRFMTEKRWVGEMMRRFGAKTRRLHNQVLRSTTFGTGYLAVLNTLLSVAALTAVYSVVTWLFPKQKKRGVKQGTSESDLFTKDEKPNPWYKETYTPSKFDYSPLTTSWKSLKPAQVEERIMRNVLHVRASYTNAKGDKCGRDYRILCLEGQMYVTNSHNVPVDDVMMTVVQTASTSGISSNFKVRLHPGDFYRDPQHDLVFFRLRCTPPKASLTGLLVTEKFTGICPGAMLVRNEDGSTQRIGLQALQRSIEDVGDTVNMLLVRGEADIVTISGHCGSPYLGYFPMGPVLLGLHILGGYTRTVACVIMSRESVDKAREALKAEFIQSGSPDLRDVDGTAIDLVELHPKSTFRFIEEGTANVYGSLPGFRAAGKTKVTKTLIHETLEEAGYEVSMGGPVLNHWMPWRLAGIDIVQQEHTINAPILDACVDSFVSSILRELPPSALREVRVLSIDATVNGLPGVKYIDRMNLTSSMGFPWNSSKENFLIEHGQFGEWEHYVEFTPDIMERVEKMRAAYAQSTRTMAVFRAHQKDEVLPMMKVLAKKTRLFSGGNGPLAILMRQHYLALVRCIQLNKFIFEAAPGTNTTSLEWCDFYHWLTKFGTDRIVAGDYSKFDKKMSPAVLLAAFRVLESILEAAGFSEEEMTITRAMKWDVVFALTDFNGDLVEFWGSNPSGHILTVIVNCMANSLYVRYAWATSGHCLSQFRENVSLLTYGDDNVMGISPDVSDFNHCVIQEELSKIGVIYTMPDKETASVPFVDISEVSFLKRSWVFSHDVGSYVARLEHDSIAKSLMYHIPSKVVCTERLAFDSMYGALREYFYYGREIFEGKRLLFESVVEKHGLKAYGKAFPTYLELVAEYLGNGLDRSPDGKCKQCAA